MNFFVRSQNRARKGEIYHFLFFLAMYNETAWQAKKNRALFCKLKLQKTTIYTHKLYTDTRSHRNSENPRFETQELAQHIYTWIFHLIFLLFYRSIERINFQRDEVPYKFIFSFVSFSFGWFFSCTVRFWASSFAQHLFSCFRSFYFIWWNMQKWLCIVGDMNMNIEYGCLTNSRIFRFWRFLY